MIKDRVIQKRIKGKVLAMAMTAVMASLFVPMEADAATDISKVKFSTTIQTSDITTGNVAISETSLCYGTGECVGHRVTANTDDGNGIIVQSGHHYIQLDGVDIKTADSAIQVLSGATTTLVLRGNSNKLVGGQAGIYVAQGGTLEVMGINENDANNCLKVKSSGEGAGIGGYGSGGDNCTAGVIRIESGTIVAEGGNRGAGIGGSGTGSVDNVVINGGNVIAKGGDGLKAEANGSTRPAGAPGIGHGNDASKIGDVVINSGNVTAIGGKDYDESSYAAGISAGTLSSYGNGNTAVVADSINVNYDGLNGLVWNLKRNEDGVLVDKDGNAINDFINQILRSDGRVNVPHGNICTVHNDAELPGGFDKPGGFQDDFNDFSNNELDEDGNPIKNQLVIPTGTSLRIPAGSVFKYAGIILGSKGSTLINPDGLDAMAGSDTIIKDMSYKVSFNVDKDVVMKAPFTYKGEPYKTDNKYNNEIFSINATRETKVSGKLQDCPVDREVVEFEIEKTDDRSYIVKDKGVKDAGDYKITFKYGSKSPTKSFTIEPLDIADSGVSVGEIPSKEYKGVSYVKTDFSEKDVIVSYKNSPVDSTDYTLQIVGDALNAGDAKINILGNNNFTGTRSATFKITPLKMGNENTDVILWDNSATWETVYNASPQQPKVKSVRVTPATGGDSLPVGELNVDYECTAGKDNYTDAGVVTVKITPKDNNFTGGYSRDYIIRPIRLKVKSITPNSSTRKYNGNAKMPIELVDADLDIIDSGINADIILPGDQGKEFEVPGNLEGTFAKPDVDNILVAVPAAEVDGSPYSNIILDWDACVICPGSQGQSAKNYTLKGDYTTTGNGSGLFKLANEVLITMGDAPKFKVAAEVTPNKSNPPQFICDLQITGDGIDYQNSSVYCYKYTSSDEAPLEQNDPRWGLAKAFDQLTYDMDPNSEATFCIKIGGSRNVPESAPQDCHVTTPKYPRSGKPDVKPALEAALNSDGETYTLTVTEPPFERNENGFSMYLYNYVDSKGEETGYLDSNILPDAEPNQTYTVYVKLAEDEFYTESEEGVPSDPITTGKVDAKMPVIICNGSEQSEGEISFQGSAEVNIKYPGSLDMDIYYTIDGNEPSPSDNNRFEAPFTVDKSVTVKAIAGKNGMFSKTASVTLSRTGDAPNNPSGPGTSNPSNNENIIIDVVPLTDALIASSPLGSTGEYSTVEDVTVPMTLKLADMKGYRSGNIIFFDLTIKIKREDGTETVATEEDFAQAGNSGITVGLALKDLQGFGLPGSVSGTTHNFAVGHMFSADNARLGVKAGDIEEPVVIKTTDGSGISFALKGTSPIALAWADVDSSDNNRTDGDGSGDGSGTGDGSGDGSGTGDGSGDGSGTGDGSGRNGASTTSTDAATQGASNGVASALSDIMPKTGDPLSFVPWIAAAVVSIGVIVGVVKKKSGKKKTPKKTVKKTTKKTKKKK